MMMSSWRHFNFHVPVYVHVHAKFQPNRAFENCAFNMTSRDTWQCHHDVNVWHKSADGTLCVCAKYKVDLIDKRARIGYEKKIIFKN